MRWIWGLVMMTAMAGPGAAAMAQDAAPTSRDPGGAQARSPGTIAPEGPQWKVFSRGARSTYLIDMSSIRPETDEVRVQIARVPGTAEPGDFSHVVDTFGVRCAAVQTQVTASIEVLEDGEASESIATDEPWSPASPGSLDGAVKELACQEKIPAGAAYASIRDYIAAGRP